MSNDFSFFFNFKPMKTEDFKQGCYDNIGSIFDDTFLLLYFLHWFAENGTLIASHL